MTAGLTILLLKLSSFVQLALVSRVSAARVSHERVSPALGMKQMLVTPK
jgi:hypothetical protein